MYAIYVNNVTSTVKMTCMSMRADDVCFYATLARTLQNVVGGRRLGRLGAAMISRTR